MKKFDFRLKIIGPEYEKELALPPGITTVGREPDNHIVLPQPKVSRHHARFECTLKECTLTDLDSANGTLVGDQKLAPEVPFLLDKPAIIVIEPFRLIFSLDEMDTPAEPQPSKGEEQATRILSKTTPKPETVEKTVDKVKAAPVVEKPAPPPAEKPLLEPPPPPQPPREPPTGEPLYSDAEPPFFPGLSNESMRYLEYLPGIYQTDFMARFMALFESFLVPVESNVDNFDLYLDPGTSPASFLLWLSNWFEITFDPTWNEQQRRLLLKEAAKIYVRRGTTWALKRVLEIYTGKPPEIIEFFDPKDPFTFKIVFPFRRNQAQEKMLTFLVDLHKPAHTSYEMEFVE
jgi:phage tail-like protein